MEITHLIPAVSLENGQQRLDHDQTRNAMESHDDPSEDGKDDDGDHRDGGEEVPDEEDGPPNWYQYCLSNRSARKMIKDALPLAISQRIPLDIFYVVMEQLRGEPKNLYNCALVCHAWHQHSISTLYSTIAITNRDVFDTLEIIVEENGGRPSTASYFHLIPLMLANHLPSLRHLILRHCGQCHDIVRYPANFAWSARFRPSRNCPSRMCCSRTIQSQHSNPCQVGSVCAFSISLRAPKARKSHSSHLSRC
ncbi:uncharacterized protein B0H18DRAFT_983082 [Fomitopsis serialis]|uniref:uncharacterized protein n=1 Tax=Fomitopsis serialis TaxID=139415 RepID=UPI002007DD93|nr:uncharacterized protein B0H18DRAFT_983082 [Neoantrodia serialis]KAH9933331.1 hypothetical protein B0H18DRAFT_983082 [Neoantrodia serialis]